MFSLAIPALFAAATPAPLTADQQERLRCVAALAIIANDQQVSGGNWPGFPSLATRGSHFAKVAGEGVVAQSGRSKEQVRDIILTEVKAMQARKSNAEIAGLGRTCVALMDRIDPAPAPPPRPYCAALVADTYDSVRRAEGNSAAAQNLGNIAAILNAGMREEWQAIGKSPDQADQAIADERSRLKSEAEALKKKGRSRTLDLDPCLVWLEK